MIALGTISPLASVIFLASASAPLSLADRHRILVGVLMLALVFENFHRVAGHYAFMRVQGTLEYYESLPIRRWMVLAAVTASFFTLSLLPISVTYVAASLYLGLPVVIAPLAPLILLLVALPISAGAAIIGLLARSGSEATAMATVATIGLISSGSVVLRGQTLPAPLQTLGAINPVAHAASSLRRTLYGEQTIDGVLIGTALVAFIVVLLWLEYYLDVYS